MRRKKGYDKSVFQSLALITQFGINMLVPIGFMTYLGWYLDKRLETSYLVIVFFFVGAVAGGRNVYRMAKQIYEQTSNRGSRMVKRKENDRESKKD